MVWKSYYLSSNGSSQLSNLDLVFFTNTFNKTFLVTIMELHYFWLRKENLHINKKGKFLQSEGMVHSVLYRISVVVIFQFYLLHIKFILSCDIYLVILCLVFLMYELCLRVFTVTILLSFKLFVKCLAE